MLTYQQFKHRIQSSTNRFPDVLPFHCKLAIHDRRLYLRWFSLNLIVRVYKGRPWMLMCTRVRFFEPFLYVLSFVDFFSPFSPQILCSHLQFDWLSNGALDFLIDSHCVACTPNWSNYSVLIQRPFCTPSEAVAASIMPTKSLTTTFATISSIPRLHAQAHSRRKSDPLRLQLTLT